MNWIYIVRYKFIIIIFFFLHTGKIDDSIENAHYQRCFHRIYIELYEEIVKKEAKRGIQGS